VVRLRQYAERPTDAPAGVQCFVRCWLVGGLQTSWTEITHALDPYRQYLPTHFHFSWRARWTRTIIWPMLRGTAVVSARLLRRRSFFSIAWWRFAARHHVVTSGTKPGGYRVRELWPHDRHRRHPLRQRAALAQLPRQARSQLPHDPANCSHRSGPGRRLVAECPAGIYLDYYRTASPTNPCAVAPGGGGGGLARLSLRQSKIETFHFAVRRNLHISPASDRYE